MELREIDLTALDNAVASLRSAVSKPPANDLERDGAIRRFEFTFELAWKSMRRFLIAMGRNQVSGSPKPILRAARAEGFIGDGDAWLGFLEARNLSTHIYAAETAREVFHQAECFVPAVTELLETLRAQRVHD